MKKSKHIVKALVIISLLTALSATVGVYLGQDCSPVRSMVDVEVRSFYRIALQDGDTLYMSFKTIPLGEPPSDKSNWLPRCDSVLGNWCFDYCADSVTIVKRQKGFCVGRGAEVVCSSSLVDDTLSVNELRKLLTVELPILEQLCKNYSLQVEELEYYARTHTAIDAGYNEVMTFAIQRKHQKCHADSALIVLKKALSEDCYAIKQSRFFVNGREVRLDYQQGGLIHLLPKDTEVPLPVMSGASLKNVLMPWTLKYPLVKTDSAGQLFYVYACDSLYQGTAYGADGSIYRGGFSKHLLREGNGFAVDDGLVKYGIWHANKFKGEQMLYTADRIYGIDISRYQHELKRPVVQKIAVKNRRGKVRYTSKKVKTVGINWSNLRISHLGAKAQLTVQGTVDYPVSFVFIKCTQGTTIRSKYYLSDMQNAKRSGIKVAPYHFFTPNKTGAQQAQFFLKNARLSQTTMPPMLDVEPTDGQIRKMGGARVMFREVLSWMKSVERAGGRKPVLYVSQTFVNRYMQEAPAALLDYDVWIARYGEYRPYVKLLLWQLTPFGRVNGIHGDVDINVFNGSREQFDQWAR